MWKCNRCESVININLSYPVHCSCGWTDYGDGKIEQTKTVGILEKVNNFTQSLIKHASSGFVNASNTIQQERLAICQSCEKYDNSNPSNPTCNECGCFLNIKTSWASESCPLKKWSAIATQSSGGCGGCGSK